MGVKTHTLILIKKIKMETKTKTEIKENISYLEKRKVKVVPIQKRNPFPGFSLEELDPITGKFETKKNIPESFNNTTRYVTVPISRSSGSIKRILDSSKRNYTQEYPHIEFTEQEFYETMLGLSRGDLDPVKTVITEKGEKIQYSFWQTEQACVKLDNSPLFLDLSKAEDMLKYKILMANTNPLSGIIAPDKASSTSSPKFQYVILDIDTEIVNDAKEIDVKTEAYKHFFDYIEGKDIDKLNKIYTSIEGKWQNSSKWDAVYVKVFEYVEKSPKEYLEIVKDKSFEDKLLLMKGVKYGEFRNIGGIFKTVDGIETGNFQETIKWLKDPENFARVEKIKERISKQK